MNFRALFTHHTSTACYREDLAKRAAAVDDRLNSATRRVLHVAKRAVNPGEQDIFTELSEGLERRRNARHLSN